MPEDSKTPAWPSPGAIAGGVLEGHAKAIEQVGEPMIKNAPRAARYVLKRIPGLPGYVYNAASIAGAPDHLREAFGVAGSMVGGIGGGALGAAAGGVNAPIGVAVGSAFGDEIGKEIYDQHREQIRRGVGDIKSWMSHRWDDLSGR